MRLVAVIVMVLLAAGCSAGPGPTAPPADTCAPWGCEQRTRFTAASALLQQQKGHIGILVKDRVSGQVWQAGEKDLRTWAGSTPKLALAVTLLERARAGTLKLDQKDTARIDAMLHVSDNEAADGLWDKFADSASTMSRWQSTYGMTQASYVDGWPKRWGFVKLTAQDLVNLMGYVLDRADPADRAALVTRMRAVGGPQQWGVWGAGAPLQPGVKDGWDYCVEKGDTVYRWVVSTVGFVGPDERYVVAALYDEAPELDLAAGVHVLTDLVATVFGASLPAPVVVPEDV
jgi:hypothetical protein